MAENRLTKTACHRWAIWAIRAHVSPWVRYMPQHSNNAFFLLDTLTALTWRS